MHIQTKVSNDSIVVRQYGRERYSWFYLHLLTILGLVIGVRVVWSDNSHVFNGSQNVLPTLSFSKEIMALVHCDR